MSDEQRALARMAASSEFGLLTRKHVLDSGVRRGALEELIRCGTLHRAARGVYTLGPPTWLDRLRAVVRFQLAGKAVVSHRSAARLHGLREGEELDVTVRYPGQATSAGVEVHRSRDLVGRVVTSIDGLPVTTVARTLCDLGLVLPPWEVRRVIEHAIARGSVSAANIESVRWGVSEHGRTGVGAVDQALAALPAAADQAESGPEVRLMALLEGTDLPTPVAQFEVTAEGRRYRIDLAYPHARLAIEYDGEAFHSSPEQQARDADRQARLERAGWRVLRFTRHDLYSAAAGAILREIEDAIRAERDL